MATTILDVADKTFDYIIIGGGVRVSCLDDIGSMLIPFSDRRVGTCFNLVVRSECDYRSSRSWRT